MDPVEFVAAWRWWWVFGWLTLLGLFALGWALWVGWDRWRYQRYEASVRRLDVRLEAEQWARRGVAMVPDPDGRGVELDPDVVDDELRGLVRRSQAAGDS